MDAKLSAAQLMELENKHGAHNYHPVPVVLDSVYLFFMLAIHCLSDSVQ